MVGCKRKGERKGWGERQKHKALFWKGSTKVVQEAGSGLMVYQLRSKEWD